MSESIFDRDEYKRYRMSWQARTQELKRRRDYYDGSVYLKTLATMPGPVRARMSASVRPLYLPLAEAVDADVGIIPGGWAWPDAEKAEGITQAMIDDWTLARRQVFDWSGWATEGVLYVQYGAETGLSVLRVADLRERRQIQIAPVDPATVMLITGGQYDSTPVLAFVVETRMDTDGNRYEYAEVITPEEIVTYADGEPEGVDDREPSYPNELGFVPFVEIEHKKTGRMYGECTYQHTLPMLDSVNEIASDLAKNIKDHGDPQWVVTGAQASDLVHSGDNVWFIPQGGDAKPLVAQIDIGGALAFIEAIAANMRSSLPELGFRELLSKDQIATATVELQLKPLVLKMLRCRPNYDQGLVEALRLVGRAASGMSLSELAVLDDENLALDDERPVLPLDRMDQINVEMAEIALEMQKQLSGGEGLTVAMNGVNNGSAQRTNDNHNSRDGATGTVDADRAQVPGGGAPG